MAACLILQAAGFVHAENDSDKYSFTCIYLEQSQALSVSMSLLYTNNTDTSLSYVEFGVYANCLRRETTIPYDNATLETAFEYGYAPSGIEFTSVKFNSEPAQYGFEGDNEAFMRVECALLPGETGEFRFEYTLLLSANRAFQGVGEDIRLCMFYPSACVYDDGFITNAASGAGRFLYAENADFELTLYLPRDYTPALYGIKNMGEYGAYTKWHASYLSANELAFTVGKRYLLKSEDNINVYGSEKGDVKKALTYALQAVKYYEGLFGSLPFGGCDIVFSDSALSYSYPGLIILGSDSDEDLHLSVYALLARQYIGCALVSDPATDPFLISGVNEYLALLCAKSIDGDAAFESLLTKRLLPALKVTIPGILTPDSYLTRFTSVSEYDTVVTKRGAAVLNELSQAMGGDKIETAFKLYYEKGAGRLNTIEDFVLALDEASGKSMGEALIAWLYTIDEYALSQSDIYD